MSFSLARLRRVTIIVPCRFPVAFRILRSGRSSHAVAAFRRREPLAYERSMARWGIAVDGADVVVRRCVRRLGTERRRRCGARHRLRWWRGADRTRRDCVRTKHVIGVDVHTPGVAAVLEAVESRGLRNVRVVEGDAIEFIAAHPDAFARRDPCSSSPTRGRSVASAIAGWSGPTSSHDWCRCCATAARSHLATDARRLRGADAAWCATRRTGLRGGVIERPSWRPVTRFERRGIDEGRSPVDLLYIASESSPSDSSSALR